jgi:hypothetical protein
VSVVTNQRLLSMDDSRFDTLARSLGTAGSRRRALGGVLAGTLGILGWHEDHETVAHNAATACKKKSGKKKRACLKKAKKHAAQHAAQTPPAPTCTDNIKNGSETDVDCGGSCPKCGVGKQCVQAADCASGYCAGGQCVVGQGTCAAGANACPGFEPSTVCNTQPGVGTCHCVIANEGGATRCASGTGVGSMCGDCATDSACKSFHPAAFCARGFAGECCSGSHAICVMPCPG